MNAYLDKLASLTPDARRIICDKATEAPHSGPYNQLSTMGTYLCRRCGLALFRAHSQFSSGCGWPSFDESLSGPNVKRSPDADGYRTEILCARCDAHLGHVFLGEHFTDKNCRYCVNSLALDFVQDNKVLDTEEALLAGGCFWGVDYYLRRLPGVLHVEVGYSGGMMANPTYEQVCTGGTGHYEVTRVIFDTAKTDYATVLKAFFEIHDPCQANGQGPDIGQQYQSAIFYYDEDQYAQATRLIQALKSNGYEATTKLLQAQPFWAAEDYHQDYYTKHPQQPYCHRPVKRFK
jgi:peptide methionine sulfoxide reductase msrA/msrB